MKELWLRFKASTPLFWKRIMYFSGSVAAAGTTLLNSGWTMNPIVSEWILRVVLISSGIGLISKFAVNPDFYQKSDSNSEPPSEPNV